MDFASQIVVVVVVVVLAPGNQLRWKRLRGQELHVQDT